MASTSSESERSAHKHEKSHSIVHEKELPHDQYPLEEQPLSPIVQHIKGWPTNPLPTNYTWDVELVLTLYDVVLCIIPVLMIVKAIICVVAARKDFADQHYGIYIEYASSLSKQLVEVNKQMTTIFTILFLAIMGTFFKRLALWKAQRGAKLSELELLQASVSPTGTLRMIAALRTFTLLGLFIVSTWVWYYVGSQAQVYEFQLKNSFNPQNYPVAFLGANALSPFEDGTWSQYTQIQKTDSNSLFHVYAQKLKGTHSGIISSDIVSNALPILYGEGAEFTAHAKDKNGFVSVPSTRDYDIISAIGTNFYINGIVDPNNPHYNSGWQAMRMLGELSFNASYVWVGCDSMALTQKKAPLGLYPTVTMSMNMTNATTTGERRTFDFWNMYNDTHALEANCGVQQLNQEVTVKCDPKACKVSKIRSRPGFANPSNETRLFSENSGAQAFFDSMLFACGRPVNTSDTSTFEADNGLAPFKTGLASGQYLPKDFTGQPAGAASVQTAAEKALGFALTKYMNTYLAASKHLKYEHGFNIQELTSDERNITLYQSDSSWDVQTMYGAEYEPNYAISWPWIVVDIVSSAVLLIASIGSLWLRLRTHAPDIFGYVSSLTRDNELLDVPGGSALGGIDRSRMMRHVQVKLGEVPTSGGQSRVAFTYVGDDEKCARTLQKGKFYV